MAKNFTKLTRTAMRKLPSGKSISEHGITFQRNQDGDGVFTINVMVDGQRIHRVVGKESDGTTRTQAEEFIAKVRQDAKNNRLSLPKGRKVALSFREAATKYLARLEDEAGKDIPKKRQRLTLHLVPFFGDMPLSRLSTFDVERYKKHRSEQPVMKSHAKGKEPTYKDGGPSAGTTNRELAVLSQLLNKAVEWGWIDHKPAKINRMKEEEGRIIYLTSEQVQTMLACAREDQNPQVHPFVAIGVETSMRMMEILSIRREHVDLNRRMIYLPTAKSGSREQPITANLARFLEGYMETLPPGTPWLFPSPSSVSGHTVNIRDPYRRVAKAAGLDPEQVVRHTLRHTAITHLVQAGVDLPTVKRISGHKTLAMVERYAHANGNHIQSAMDKLEARLKVE